MIALLDDDKYFYDDKGSIREFLVSYAEYIGLDMKIFRVLAKSEEMAIEDLIGYINRYATYDEIIKEIYEIGKKVY